MDSLQFNTAEFGDKERPCAACKKGLGVEFYQLAGHNICGDCAAKVRVNQQRPSHADVTRGLLYGAGAAVGCFIGYSAFIMITGIQFALVAIAVGFAIGYAVRKGSRGLGGRRCQAAAVALTYCAISFSVIPVGIQQLLKDHTVTTEAASPISDASPASVPLAILAICGFALVSPFLELSTGVSGLIGLAILFFGMRQAWRMTARDSRALTGPFQRQPEAAVG